MELFCCSPECEEMEISLAAEQCDDSGVQI